MNAKTPVAAFNKVIVKMLEELQALQQALKPSDKARVNSSLLHSVTIISQFESNYIRSLVFPSPEDNDNTRVKKFSLLYIIFNKIKSAKLSTENRLFNVSNEFDRANFLSSTILPEEKSPQYFDAKTRLTVEQFTQKDDLDLLLMLNAYFLPLKKNATDSRSVFENFVSEFLVYVTMLSSDYIKQDKVTIYQFQEVDAYKYYFLEQVIPITSEIGRNTLRIISGTLKLLEKALEIAEDMNLGLDKDSVSATKSYIAVQEWLEKDDVFDGLLQSTESNSAKVKVKSFDDLFSELELLAQEAFIGLEFFNNALVNISARQPCVDDDELTQFNTVITCLQGAMIEIHGVLDRFIKLLCNDFVEKFRSVKKARAALNASEGNDKEVITPRSRLSDSGIDQIRQGFISEEIQRDSQSDDFLQRHLVTLRKKPLVVQKKLAPLGRSKRDALMAAQGLNKK